VTGFLSVVVAAVLSVLAGTAAGTAESNPVSPAESPAASSAESTGAPWVGVRGNQLVDQAGEPVRLLGVNRSGTEYACQQDTGIFDGPSDAASIEAIASWDANAVRVPLNESCWLGINGVPPEYSGAAYREAIVGWVTRLEEGGMYVILDLQFAAPGTKQAEEIIPMPDADHAPAFWTSVAETFKEDRGVVFDLYNEPHEVSWGCWENGCRVEDEKTGTYQATGMKQLVEAVRATGAKQPLMLSGINYAHNLTQWESHLPPDPLDAEVASLHTYDFGPCGTQCRAGLAILAESHPLVAGEIGETDCRHGYIDGFMDWADEHGVSYLGWAWDAHGGWTCKSGPALITEYDGTPTGYGVGLRDHLRSLAKSP
jgi:endoglucanase